MSVQAGIWNFDGRPIDPKLINDLSESLKQQGPDGESRYVDGSIVLLYRPFHTTADSRWEKQPYFSRRGFALTWDGRLDNRDELIAEFRCLEPDPSDIAIAATAFDHWETDCFRRFIGDWAVAIWKGEQRELIFAADYMAVRHIFYYLKNDHVWWSTDLTPLVILSGDKFRIDDDYIAGYFANEPDPHLTPYREIREVPPGSFVRVCDGSILAERYWHFNTRRSIRYKTDAEYEEHFRHVFRQSVRRRLRSDSPILAELSGGIDSSSIVCMADSILAKGESQAPKLDTLSYYDKTEPNGDDWLYLQTIEQYRSRTGHRIDASRVEVSAAPFEYSEFSALPGTLGSWKQLEDERATVVREGGYRAVLSGIGGDEFLGGIPDPRALLGDLLVQFKWISLARQLAAWSLVKRRPWIHLLWQAAADLLPSALAQYLGRQAAVEPWIGTQFARRTKLAARRLDVDDHLGFWLPSRRCHAGGMALMSRKLAKSISTFTQVEESRYPYLDQTLMDFLLSIPANQLLRPGERRSLMRRSLIGVVPQAVLSRRTKQFGTRTALVVVGKNWDRLQTDFEAPLSAVLSYVNPAIFLTALHAAKNGQSVHVVRMYRAIALELWLRDLASRRLIDIVVPRMPSLSDMPFEGNAETTVTDFQRSC